MTNGTPHIQPNGVKIAKTVLMPGDPLRAKYIADNFLENVEQFNEVRNMFGYTGTYKGKEISVMGSGMGIPSIGIYSYELYNFFDVETIIRVGSCGALQEDVNLYDVIIAQATTNSNYATKAVVLLHREMYYHLILFIMQMQHLTMHGRKWVY